MAGEPFSQRSLADWATGFRDFTEFRLPEMDVAGIDVQVLSRTVPAYRAARMRRRRGRIWPPAVDSAGPWWPAR